MSSRRTLSLEHLTAPPRCVACRDQPTGTVSVRAETGIDLIWIGWRRGADVPLPACDACRSRRSTWGILGFLATLAILGGLIALPLAVRDPRGEAVMGLVWFALVAIVVVIYYERNLRAPWTDAHVLGVRGRGVSGDLTEVTLEFADEVLAREIDGATARAMIASVAAARAYLDRS
jgi:hypothetical protein